MSGSTINHQHWLRRINPLINILSSKKSFREPWIGSHRLNRMGLHILRMRLAELCHGLRDMQRPAAQRWPRFKTLRRDGVVVIENFLPEVAWRSAQAECRQYIEWSLEQHAPPAPCGAGFGPKRPFPGGFDRYDGDTLNRYLDISPGRSPEAFRIVRDQRLLSLCSAAQTRPTDPSRFTLYYTRNGDERYPDIQKAMHHDTFHHAIKCWLFLESVDESQGPFMYVPGSHRLTPARISWERAMSIRATRPGVPGGSSSFRASECEIRAMGYRRPRSYPVRANTLIIADVLGFHARGPAEPGTERVAIYAGLRPWPFNLLAY